MHIFTGQPRSILLLLVCVRHISQKNHPAFVVERTEHVMEEQQIRDFVHRVSTEETLRTELANNPQSVIERENFSPKVAQVIMQLVPHLALAKEMKPSLQWWKS